MTKPKPKPLSWNERQARSSAAGVRESLKKTVLLHNYFFYGSPTNEQTEEPHPARDDTPRGGGAGQAH